MKQFHCRIKGLLLRPWVAAVISGIMVATSYIPAWPWALFFCYIPLWQVSLRSSSWKKTFLYGWLTQLILSLIGFHWIYIVAHDFGFLPPALSVMVLLLFASLVHWHIPLALIVTKILAKAFKLNDTMTILTLPFIHFFLEKHWPMIFPWHLGYTLLYAGWPAAQVADTIGFTGLNFFILMTQAVLLLSLHRASWKTLRAHLPTVSGIFMFWSALNLWGLGKQRHIQSLDYQTISAGVVQANIGNFEKLMAERGQGYQKEIIDRYFTLSQQLLSASAKTLDLLIWPEAAIPEFLDQHNQDRKYASYFFSQLQGLRTPLVTGAYSSDPMERMPRRDFNGLFVFDREAHWASPPYRKTKLLIFGEWLPFSETFPELKKYNPAGSGFSAGEGPQVLLLDSLKIGAQICYESLDPQFSVKLKRLGANIIINLTNDSWFGFGFEPWQHLYMTLARAIETRIPLIRTTNTGITAAIDNSGHIYELSPLGKEWTHRYEIKAYKLPSLSLFVRFGALGPFLLIILWLIIWAWSYHANTSENYERGQHE